MNRDKITLYDTIMDVLLKMAEGNPGGINVLMQMVETKDPTSMIRILDLDDMNIRGSQIWVGYKDYCGENIEAFLKAVKDRDPKMIDKINEECYHPEMAYEGYDEKAVLTGKVKEDDGCEDTCLRCSTKLISSEDWATGICPECWTEEDEKDGPMLNRVEPHITP